MRLLELERPVEMLLALLRAAIHRQEVETECFRHATAEDWIRCYRLAVRQGVPALSWSAIERLPKEYTPPLDVKLSWALLEEKQLEKYQKHCQAADELTRLYARHGIATVILKGIGLSRLYPTPAHREGGDIDIYTYSADKNRMTDDEANRLANELMERHGINVDYSYAKVHSSFCYHGVRFENHCRFLNFETFTKLAELEEWLEIQLYPQPASLLDKTCDIHVPSVAFDKVFVPLHAAQHYGNGLSLRHLCDWAILSLQEESPIPVNLDNKYLLRATTALSQLTNRYLGTSNPVENRDNLPYEMMKEIIHHPFNHKQPFKNTVRAGWYKVRLKLHLLWLRHRLLGVPLLKGIWNLAKSVLHKPSRLYK